MRSCSMREWSDNDYNGVGEAGFASLLSALHRSAKFASDVVATEAASGVEESVASEFVMQRVRPSHINPAGRQARPGLRDMQGLGRYQTKHFQTRQPKNPSAACLLSVPALNLYRFEHGVPIATLLRCYSAAFFPASRQHSRHRRHRPAVAHSRSSSPDPPP